MSNTRSIPDTPRAASWADTAACRSEDPDLFHAGERDPKAMEEARSICNRCPSRAGCLTAAYQEGDDWGVRGGLTPRQRRAALRKANGDITQAVAEATGDATALLRRIYSHHARPDGDGHVRWTDHRHQISVRNTVYTPNQLAFQAHYGRPPVGHVERVCDVERCVARACLADRPMRERAAIRQKTAA